MRWRAFSFLDVACATGRASTIREDQQPTRNHRRRRDHGNRPLTVRLRVFDFAIRASRAAHPWKQLERRLPFRAQIFVFEWVETSGSLDRAIAQKLVVDVGANAW